MMGKTLPWNRKLIVEQLLSNQNRAVMLDVTRHMFMLRADMARLRRFIDSYLNFVDDDMPPPFYFQPAAPFVMFELLSYPYLSVASRNLTSYPQREMSFSVPLECYAIEDGVLVFKQYAVCIPFLYVDEALSIVSGRDLFGLPKVAMKFENLIDQIRPDVPSQIGRLSLRVPGPTGDVYRPFIEVYRDPPRFISIRQTPENLINALPDAIRGYTSFAADAWEALARPPLRGYDNQRDVQSMLGMLRANVEAFYGAFPMFPFMRPAPEFSESSADEQLGPLYADLISLKQVRDAELPDYVSFQALVKSTMYIDRINDGGLLFGPLGSDPTSDVTIKIHHTIGQPLVESLGLMTEETSSGGGAGRSVGAGGEPTDAPQSRALISTLKPVFPFWLNMDLVYGLGTNLYWRGRKTDWSSTDYPGPPSSKNEYITQGGGALQENASRVVSPKCLIWVLKLPLDLKNDGRERLMRLVSENLDNDCYEFRLAQDEPWVWMFIRDMDNSAEGRGPEAEQEVEFAAIVEWFDKKDSGAVGKAIGKALMPIFVLTDNQTAAFTESEVFGRPTVRADINFDSLSWTSGAVGSVMNVKTLIVPELYAGGAPTNRCIVRVDVDFIGLLGDTPNGKDLEPLRFPTVALKQVVDCRLPDRADFQAIVFRVLEIKQYKDKLEPGSGVQPKPRKLDADKWSVVVPRYRSLPLVQKLGLEVDSRTAGEYTTEETIRPCKVWAFPGTVEELGSLNLAWRIGNSPWMSHVDALAELRRIAPRMSTAMELSTTALENFLTNAAVFFGTSTVREKSESSEHRDD